MSVPDLRGTWSVRLDTDWLDGGSGAPHDPIEAFFAVTQTFSKLQLRLLTLESESWLLAYRIDPSPKGPGYQIFAVYLNQPVSHLRGARSEIHYGGMVLDTHGLSRRPNGLAGEYWTDRGTKGTINARWLSNEVHTRYSVAKRLLSN